MRNSLQGECGEMQEETGGGKEKGGRRGKERSKRIKDNAETHRPQRKKADHSCETNRED